MASSLGNMEKYLDSQSCKFILLISVIGFKCCNGDMTFEELFVDIIVMFCEALMFT